METHSDGLFLSAVTVAEISDGIAKMERTGSASRAGALKDWLELVLHLYGERVLPFDVAAARLAGKLMDKARATGHSPGFADVAIAATAGSPSPVETRPSCDARSPRADGRRRWANIARVENAFLPVRLAGD